MREWCIVQKIISVGYMLFQDCDKLLHSLLREGSHTVTAARIVQVPNNLLSCEIEAYLGIDSSRTSGSTIFFGVWGVKTPPFIVQKSTRILKCYLSHSKHQLLLARDFPSAWIWLKLI